MDITSHLMISSPSLDWDPPKFYWNAYTLKIIIIIIYLYLIFVGKFAVWMIPQLFAYAINFPMVKFLQAQRKVLVMLWISVVVLVLHTFFSWFLIFKLGWGLIGAAITLNTSWWVIVIAQLLYIFITKSDGAWNGFTWLAFSDLFGFVKLSLASAVMLWYFSLANFILHWTWLYIFIFAEIKYGVKCELLQLGVLVFDDTGGDNRAFEKSSSTSWCHIYLVKISLPSLFSPSKFTLCGEVETWKYNRLKVFFTL